MAQIFTALLLTSVIGTALAVVLVLLKPITRKVFSAGWHYYIWLVVLFVMVLPVRLSMPEKNVTATLASGTATGSQIENAETPINIIMQSEQIEQEHPVQIEKVAIAQTIKNFFITNLPVFSSIWLVNAFLLFLIKIVRYIAFCRRMLKNSEIISCPEIKTYTNRKIRTRVSDTICSPLIIGIISPTLLLPKTDITPKQLNNILAHETTHLKRSDILYKWFVSIVKCVHWFNPAIYFISRQINIDCEISCDSLVVKEMNEQQRKEYAETILSLLTRNNSKTIPLTTGMTGEKKTLKKRFLMIKKRKRVGKVARILSMVLAIVILLTTVFASGVAATEIFDEVDFGKKSEIEVRHNGYLLPLSNKPFYMKSEVYLPLKEVLEKAGLVNAKDCYINLESGKILLCITEGDNVTEYDSYGKPTGNKAIKIQYYFGLEIGKSEYIINPAETQSEKSRYLDVRQEMTSAPILRHGIVYVSYEYIDHLINRVTNNHRITILDVSGISRDVGEMNNAENMTYEEIRSLQIDVDNGHFSWRLDPEQVITAFLSGKGVNVEDGKITALAGGSKGISATYSIGGNKYLIELFKPLDTTERGVWIVKTFQRKGNAIMHKVYFYERTPGRMMIEKQENGWYKVPQRISAFFEYEGETPGSVVAYYTQTGTEMEDYKKVIGRINAPYTYQTMSQVLSIDLNFSEEDTIGHLWFVLNFEDGSSEMSEIYNIIVE